MYFGNFRKTNFRFSLSVFILKSKTRDDEAKPALWPARRIASVPNFVDISDGFSLSASFSNPGDSGCLRIVYILLVHTG